MRVSIESSISDHLSDGPQSSKLLDLPLPSSFEASSARLVAEIRCNRLYQRQTTRSNRIIKKNLNVNLLVLLVFGISYSDTPVEIAIAEWDDYWSFES